MACGQPIGVGIHAGSLFHVQERFTPREGRGRGLFGLLAACAGRREAPRHWAGRLLGLSVAWLSDACVRDAGGRDSLSWRGLSVRNLCPNFCRIRARQTAMGAIACSRAHGQAWRTRWPAPGRRAARPRCGDTLTERIELACYSKPLPNSRSAGSIGAGTTPSHAMPALVITDKIAGESACRGGRYATAARSNTTSS